MKVILRVICEFSYGFSCRVMGCRGSIQRVFFFWVCKLNNMGFSTLFAFLQGIYILNSLEELWEDVEFPYLSPAAGVSSIAQDHWP